MAIKARVFVRMRENIFVLYDNNLNPLQYVTIDPQHIHFEASDVPMSIRWFFSEISAIFTSNLQLTCGPQCKRVESTVTVLMSVTSHDDQLDWNTDESYRLEIVTKGRFMLFFLQFR